MKKFKIIVSLLSILAILVSSFSSIEAFAYSSNSSRYVYTVNVRVDNPCNSDDMDDDAVNDFHFDYYYNGLNGYQGESHYRYDMSWNGGSNNNSKFLWDHFIRSNDDSFDTSFQITLDGKLNRLYIMLNMDGGERLSLTVTSIYCNGKRINNNEDYVSSAYGDSEANIYCSMERSVIDKNNSPYFDNNDDMEISEKEMNSIVENVNGSHYAYQFKDQYNATIDVSVLNRCVASSDGDINQYYSHHDEESMYKYILYFDVENPINLNDADYDEVETFYIEFNYIDQNGYGSSHTYTLDMAYSDSLNRNKNPDYLSYFETYNDNEYKTHFSVWVPGIVTSVKMKLNMSGEKLCADLEKVTLNSLEVNTNRDYISSTYYDSSAEIKCTVPASQIAATKDNLSSSYQPYLVDQYGSIVSENLYDKAQSDKSKYLYHQQ